MAAETPVLKPAVATTAMGEKAPPGNAEVMGALRRQKGAAPQRSRSPVDILRDGLMDQIGDPAQVQQLISEYDRLAQAGLTRLVQLGGTVFLVNQFDSNQRMLPKGTAEVHLFTEEPLEVLGQRFAAAANTFRQLGYQRVVSYSPEPGITRVLQSAAAPARAQLKVTQDVQNIAGKMTPVYRIEVTL